MAGKLHIHTFALPRIIVVLHNRVKINNYNYNSNKQITP